jgi:hypothetical protein
MDGRELAEFHLAQQMPPPTELSLYQMGMRFELLILALEFSPEGAFCYRLTRMANGPFFTLSSKLDFIAAVFLPIGLSVTGPVPTTPRRRLG